MILVVGEALVDILVDPRGEVSSQVGGAPLNTARAAARLGVPTTFLGGISTDSLGSRILRLLDDDGVRLGMHRVAAPTTLAIAAVDDAGAATYRFLVEDTSAAAVTAADVADRLSPDVRVLLVGTLGLVLQPLAEASLAAVAAASPEQVVVVDPNYRPALMTGSAVFRDALPAALRRADVVKVSGDDLGFLYPGIDALAAAVRLQEDSDAIVLFTDGPDAVRVVSAGGVDVLDVPVVDVVDTVGAGDSFSGGFLAFWVHEGLTRADLGNRERVLAAARFGIDVAAVTVQRAGADPPFAHEVPGGWT